VRSDREWGEGVKSKRENGARDGLDRKREKGGKERGRKREKESEGGCCRWRRTKERRGKERREESRRRSK
jgi:hypothetical protein